MIVLTSDAGFFISYKLKYMLKNTENTFFRSNIMNIFTKACLIQLGLAAKPRNPHQGIRMFRSCSD